MRFLLASLLALPLPVSGPASAARTTAPAPPTAQEQDADLEEEPGRLEIGERLPRFALEGLTGTPARSVDEYHGRTLLLAFFAFWEPDCVEPVAGLNDLQREQSARGLDVLGVTREEPFKTAPWVREHGLEVAWGKDIGGFLSDLLEVVDLPYFVLVDPFGEVRWRGPARRLGEMQLEPALEGALETPVWSWPDEARTLLPLLVEGRYGEALSRARKLPADDGADALTLVGRLVLARMQALEKSLARGELYRAHQLCGRLADELAGTPEGEAIAARLEEMGRDPRVRAQLALAQRIEECEQRIRNLKQARKQQSELKRILDEVPSPELAERAQRRLDVVRDVLERSRENRARLEKARGDAEDGPHR